MCIFFSFLVASLVPLQLCLIEKNSNRMIWKNERYSSPRFCRPISFEFTKETVENTNDYMEDINKQIASLQETRISINNCRVSVNHTMILSMINGKVVSLFNFHFVNFSIVLKLIIIAFRLVQQ